MYVVIIQLHDPRTDAIEFVLKDSRNDTWLVFLSTSLLLDWIFKRGSLEFK